MFATLLPGFRDLRAPLAAGYLWLAAAWVWFAERLPSSPEEASGLLKKAYELAEAAGRPAIGVAVSFAAYLIGAVATEIWTRILGTPVRVTNQLGSSLWYYAVGVLDKILSRISYRWRARRRSRREIPRLDPVMEEVHGIVIDELDSKFNDEESFRDQVRHRLTPTFIRHAEEKIYGFEPEKSIGKDEVMQRAVDDPYLRRELLTAMIDTLRHVFEIVEDLRYVPERIMETKLKSLRDTTRCGVKPSSEWRSRYRSSSLRLL
jgi:hypothetical protein